MRRKKRKPRNEVRFSKLFLVGVLFLFGLMAARTVELALADKVDGINLQVLASKRTTKTDVIKAERGTIYTSDKEVLAQNVSSYKLIAYLEEKRTTDKNNPQHVVDKEMTAEKLAPILGMEKDEILGYLSKDKYQTEFGSKGKGLTELTKDKIEALNLPGIDFIESYKRYYPKGDFLSYIIGYAKDSVKENEDGEEEVTIEGELGIEKYYDDTLRGKDGYITYQKDLRGYKIPDTKEDTKEREDGKDIYLTINNSIQFFVEQALDNAEKVVPFEWFTIMVADAKTGAILAASTTPSFNPNTRNITNYVDLNVGLPYEPGSTMKIFTYMTALENGVYDGNETYHSGVFVTKDGTEIGDWKREGWGTISFDRGFALSSNVGVINIIDRHLTANQLKSYFKKLGFGKKTGISLPGEAAGKLDFKYETEVFNAGFGQGITTTPIQNIQALTSLTNNGVMLKPYLVEKIVDPDTNEVIFKGKRTEVGKVASENTVNKIKDLMWTTVNEPGNTASSYKLDGYDVIGKTGTAQIADPEHGGYLQGADNVISSFAGAYPKNDPKVIIYGSVKKALGGNQNVLINAVKDIIVNISKYYGTSPKQEEVKQQETVTLSNYQSKKTTAVKEELERLGLNVTVLGSGDKIVEQYPKKNETLAVGSKVFLITSDDNLTVPDVTGLSSKQAESLLKLLKITVTLDGTGYVTAQSVEPNTKIVDGMTIHLTLTPKF